MTYDDFDVGYRGSYSQAVTAEDNALFAKISGDYNPIHFRSDVSAETAYKAPISNGFIAESRIAAALVNAFGSDETLVIGVRKSVRYLKPVYIGEVITAEVEVVERLPLGRLLRVKARCVNAEGEVVVKATFLVQILAAPGAPEPRRKIMELVSQLTGGWRLAHEPVTEEENHQ